MAFACEIMIMIDSFSLSFSPSLENRAIDLPPSYFVSGCNLSVSPGLKSKMFPLFVYRSPPCLARLTFLF